MTDPAGTFDPNDPSASVNIVRMMIGDTTSPFIIADATISHYESQQTADGSTTPNNYTTAIACLELIAAAYSQLNDQNLGGVSVNYKDQYAQITQLIDRYRTARAEQLEVAWRQNPSPIFFGTKDKDMLAIAMGNGTTLLMNDPAQRPFWT